MIFSFIGLFPPFSSRRPNGCTTSVPRTATTLSCGWTASRAACRTPRAPPPGESWEGNRSRRGVGGEQKVPLEWRAGGRKKKRGPFNHSALASSVPLMTLASQTFQCFCYKKKNQEKKKTLGRKPLAAVSHTLALTASATGGRRVGE